MYGKNVLAFACFGVWNLESFHIVCTNHLTNLPKTSSKAAKLLKIYHRFANIGKKYFSIGKHRFSGAKW
jgi:hypothetical protein